jgi:hypothetical protein
LYSGVAVSMRGHWQYVFVSLSTLLLGALTAPKVSRHLSARHFTLSLPKASIFDWTSTPHFNT